MQPFLLPNFPSLFFFLFSFFLSLFFKVHLLSLIRKKNTYTGRVWGRGGTLHFLGTALPLDVVIRHFRRLRISLVTTVFSL